MEHGTRFFGRGPVKTESTHGVPEYSFINVGGEQFHAMAVVLMDFFKRSTRVNEDALKKILERFYHYFPKYISNQSYLTPAERMGMLLGNSRKTEVVECMAYVLRQLVVDEFFLNPLKYREAFDGLERTTSKEFLRHADVSFSAKAFCDALSHLLDINISLSHLEHGKELRKQEVYTRNEDNTPKAQVVLQIQGDRYYPGVKNPNDFAFVGQLAVKPVQPVVDAIVSTETLAECIDLIVADNQRLLRDYVKWRQNLLTMVQTNELTTAGLLALYVRFLPSDNKLVANPVVFFAQLTQEQFKPVAAKPGAQSQQLTELLVNSLACWISSGLVDSENLFEHAEQRMAHVAGPVV